MTILPARGLRRLRRSHADRVIEAPGAAVVGPLTNVSTGTGLRDGGHVGDGGGRTRHAARLAACTVVVPTVKRVGAARGDAAGPGSIHDRP